MNVKSCIQTIDLLRKLALNVHGVIDVVDDRNCQQIVDLLKEQEPKQVNNVAQQISCFSGICPNCGKMLNTTCNKNFCGECGQAVTWE